MRGARRRALLCAAAAVAIADGPRGVDALGQELPDCERVALEFDNTCANDDGTGSYQDPPDPLATASASCTADSIVCPDGTAATAAGCAAQFVAHAFCRRTLHAARRSPLARSLTSQLYLTRARAGTPPGSARGAGTSASRVATMGAS
eukprot:COSAG06_NODE_4570_length_4137_cov_1.758791_2_plen_148_part_00